VSAPKKFKDLISQCMMLLLCRYITPAQHSFAMRSLIEVGSKWPRECTEEEMQESSMLGIEALLPMALILWCAPLQVRQYRHKT
jgi:hypothetical protein